VRWREKNNSRKRVKTDHTKKKEEMKSVIVFAMRTRLKKTTTANGNHEKKEPHLSPSIPRSPNRRGKKKRRDLKLKGSRIARWGILSMLRRWERKKMDESQRGSNTKGRKK